jgi:hypothetical protein
MPRIHPEVSAYFSELVGRRYAKLGKKGRSECARNAAKKGWAGMSKRQRLLEMRRRHKVRRQNRIKQLRQDEELREKIAKRKAGLDD